MSKLTLYQAVVITGYTGILACKNFSDFHNDVEKRLGHGVFTHEFADIDFKHKLKELYKKDFFSLIGLNND